MMREGVSGACSRDADFAFCTAAAADTATLSLAFGAWLGGAGNPASMAAMRPRACSLSLPLSLFNPFLLTYRLLLSVEAPAAACYIVSVDGPWPNCPVPPISASH